MSLDVVQDEADVIDMAFLAPAEAAGALLLAVLYRDTSGFTRLRSYELLLADKVRTACWLS